MGRGQFLICHFPCSASTPEVGVDWAPVPSPPPQLKAWSTCRKSQMLESWMFLQTVSLTGALGEEAPTRRTSPGPRCTTGGLCDKRGRLSGLESGREPRPPVWEHRRAGICHPGLPPGEMTQRPLTPPPGKLSCSEPQSKTKGRAEERATVPSDHRRRPRPSQSPPAAPSPLPRWPRTKAWAAPGPLSPRGRL